MRQTATVSDKVKNRLEQLDDFEDGSVKEMLNLSQQDYVKRIDELNKALIQSWNNDQKVKALKIAIQVIMENQWLVVCNIDIRYRLESDCGLYS